MFSRDYSEFADRPIERKTRIFVFVLFGLMVLLAVRLFQIQVFNHDLYLNKSEDYRIKRIIIEAPRGFIYDRNKEMLATNRLSYAVTIDPFERKNYDKTIPRLASLVPDFRKFFGYPGTNLIDSIKTMTNNTLNPSVLIQDADFKTQSIIEEHILDLPGIGCVMGQRRYYPHDMLACHILGYMGKLTKSESEKMVENGYYKDQMIGRFGIENFYEGILKGKNGAKFQEKNYLNRLLGDIYKPDPAISGKDLRLTIDYRLQYAAEQAFGDTIRGAFVALNPKTGEIYVMASSPSFDPNDFASVLSGNRYRALIENPEKPLYNRSIQGLYPPGSTFKMITALAGLENGISKNTRFQACHGYYRFGRDYNCWNRDKGGHGSLDMVGALTQSCNVYFYQLGLKVGIEKWAETAAKLGIGTGSGIDLYGEESGNLPSMAFYKKAGINYSGGMMLNLAIGQGENSVTPLQLAHYIAIIASEGIDAEPHLVMNAGTYKIKKVDISQESFKVVKEGMFGVVEGVQGTAKGARIPGHQIAGKTGTAQNPHGQDHKIFVSFAPFQDPGIVTACIAENSGNIKPSLAITITKRVLEEYFKYYKDPFSADSLNARKLTPGEIIDGDAND